MKNFVDKLELLSPAGDLEKLETAGVYGADAAYIGLNGLSLRAPQQLFTGDYLQKAIEIKNKYNMKLYGACNMVMRDGDFATLERAIKEAYEMGIDAVIASDLGALCLIKKWCPDLEVHMSTQANILNSVSCNTYYDMGAKRVVLARELTLDEIATVRANTNPDLDLEAFCHGAMCISYSGRCLLSAYMTGRDSNRGECAQPCRWKYKLYEEKRPDYPFTIGGSEHGTYIMNAKDMCMIEHLDLMAKAGITSFKIEGRMKTPYYVAVTTNAYRKALDILKKDPENYKLPPEVAEEVNKVSHREYCKGFYFGNPYADGQLVHTSDYVRDYTLVGVVTDYDSENKRLYIEQRNKFYRDDILDVLTTKGESVLLAASDLRNPDGEIMESAPHAQQIVSIACDTPFPKNSMLRRKCKWQEDSSNR